MNTEATFCPPGYAATKLRRGALESATVGELRLELARRITEMESQGLLSVSGKTLLLSLQNKTPTPSTDGSAQRMDYSGTSTYHPVLEAPALQQVLQKPLREGDIVCTNRGLSNQKVTQSSGILTHADAFEGRVNNPVRVFGDA